MRPSIVTSKCWEQDGPRRQRMRADGIGHYGQQSWVMSRRDNLRKFCRPLAVDRGGSVPRPTTHQTGSICPYYFHWNF